MDTGLTTLAEELKRLNYSPHIVGKWHLGFCNKKYWPTRRGFAHHYGFMNGLEDYYTHSRRSSYDFWDDDKVLYEANGTYSSTLLQ